jgi:hypothetical protein
MSHHMKEGGRERVGGRGWEGEGGEWWRGWKDTPRMNKGLKSIFGMRPLGSTK